jgi:hypothetical protein
LRVASLPEGVKPVIDREATNRCSGRALRGERGQRMPTESSGT